MSGASQLWRAPAKINLFLHILGRRPDGYHQLRTLMQLLDFGDLLEVREHKELRLRCDGMDAGQDNLVLRAARLLQTHSGTGRGACMRLHKRTPVAAGLGGGSSDAAAALLALNRLWGCRLGRGELMTLGLALGADVPFFVGGHSALAEGRGEQLRPLALPRRWFLLLCPQEQVSTARIFNTPELTVRPCGDTMPPCICEGDAALNASVDGEDGPGAATGNDCTAALRKRHPAIAQMLDATAKALADEGLERPVRLSGTGGSFFAAFANAQDAGRAMRALTALQMPARPVLATGISSRDQARY